MGKTNSDYKKKREKIPKRKKKKSSSISDSSRSSLSSPTRSSTTSQFSIEEKIKKKLKHLKRKERKRKKKEKKALKKLFKSKVKEKIFDEAQKSDALSSSCNADVSLMERSKSLAPMTKEEWEKQQSTLKRVFDENTGRMRLVRGTGEIVEECVSRERHLAINKQATKGDGEFFQKKLLQQMK